MTRMHAFDADYGPYTGHPGDPRTPDDESSESDDMLMAITEAEEALMKARALIEASGPRKSLLAARSLMNEAVGWLKED